MKEFRKVVFAVEMDVEVEVDNNDPVEYADELFHTTDADVASLLSKSNREIKNISFGTWYS